jgi:outer membrane protein
MFISLSLRKESVQKMNLYSKILILGTFSFISITSVAQEKPRLEISLNEAIKIGLENNFGVKIADINRQIADNNNTYGNAGYYPQVYLQASQNNNLTNTRQQFLDGRTINLSGAYSNSIQSGIFADWIFFDGFRMQAAKSRLEETLILSELSRQALMEQTVANIVNDYFSIVQQLKFLELTRVSLNLSRERLDLAESKEKIGSSAGVSTLQSTIDYNNDSLTLMNQLIQLDMLKNQLAQTLQLKVSTEITVDTTINWPELPEYNQILTSFVSQNIQLKQARSQVRINEFQIKEAKSFRFPVLALNGGFNYNVSQSQAGFVLQNIGYGPVLGISLRQNIFDGNNVKREIENTRLNGEILKMQLEESQTFQTRQLDILIDQHKSMDQVIKVQASNVDFTKQSLDIAVQRYRLGAITDIEFREIQLLNISATNQLYQTELLKRQLEIEMLRISGNLMQR